MKQTNKATVIREARMSRKGRKQRYWKHGMTSRTSSRNQSERLMKAHTRSFRSRTNTVPSPCRREAAGITGRSCCSISRVSSFVIGIAWEFRNLVPVQIRLYIFRSASHRTLSKQAEELMHEVKHKLGCNINVLLTSYKLP